MARQKFKLTTAIIMEIVTTITMIITIFKEINMQTLLKWLWQHITVTIWFLTSIWLVYSYIKYYTDRKREAKRIQTALIKWNSFITVENQLFQIDAEKYRENFSWQELEDIGFSSNDIKTIFPLPKELKEEYEKKLKEYWNKKS